MGQEETVEAINCAREAFMTFRNTLAKDREQMLLKVRDFMVSNADDFGSVLTMEMGKPLAEAKGEVMYAASYMDWFAAESRRIYGDIAPPNLHGRRLLFAKQPVGVVGFITPWNFPSAMLARKFGAAIATGCTIVTKPAEDTPFSTTLWAKACEYAGIPKGVFNVITCSRDNADIVGRTLCTHPKVAKISFTGSTPVGKLLMKQAAEGMKRFSGELGGNAPFIVFNSADLDKAVAGLMASKFRCSGQTCICSNRIFVQDGVYDEFVAKFKQAVAGLVVGNGMDKGITQGPLINQKAVDKVKDLCDDAVSKGAKAVLGGKIHQRGGYFFEPTVLTEVGPGMKIFEEEIFGPIASIIRFKSESEVVEKANDTRSGLASYFYSQDYSQVWRVAEQLEYGMVGINEGAPSSVEIPFGGVKESGFGREGSKYGCDDYLSLKLMCFGNVDSKPQN